MISLGHARPPLLKVSSPIVPTNAPLLLRTWAVSISPRSGRTPVETRVETHCALLVGSLSSWEAKAETATEACVPRLSRHATPREPSHLLVSLAISAERLVRGAIDGASSFLERPRPTVKSHLLGRHSPRLLLFACTSPRDFRFHRIALPRQSRRPPCPPVNSAHLPSLLPDHRRAIIGGSRLLLCPNSS